MLLKRVVLDQIVAGEIDLVFRRWKRPTVAAGGSLRTSVGMLAIESVDRTSLRAVTTDDAKRAGFESRAALLRELSSRDVGDVYRIAVRHAGDDPRVALRENADLDDDELAQLVARLERLDRSSKRGPWTAIMLRLLADNPKVRAQDLAEGVGLDKPTLKNDVRRLKALGLTISHSPGYELSPRGHALLSALDDDGV
ncbi:MAG: hypothetical protein ACR2P0_00400 [Acidimicrobiales bacterium]